MQDTSYLLVIILLVSLFVMYMLRKNILYAGLMALIFTLFTYVEPYYMDLIGPEVWWQDILATFSKTLLLLTLVYISHWYLTKKSKKVLGENV